MGHNIAKDQFALIRIDGMHCHQCEASIRKAISTNPGVHEVEVDFLSRQASVLFDPSQVKISELTSAVEEAGYRVAGFTQGAADSQS